MKKLVMMLLAAVLAHPVFGQSYTPTYAKVPRYDHTATERYYGLRLGLNIASVNSDDIAMDYTARTGFSFGFVYGQQLTNAAPLWLEFGLSYSEKGGVSSEMGDDVEMRMTYLSVPVVCKYSFELDNDLCVQPFVGGYLALGVIGKIKDYANRIAQSSYDAFNRFDGGLRFGCGFEYQMIYAEAGVEFGLVDFSKDDFSAARNQNVFLNIGVNF